MNTANTTIASTKGNSTLVRARFGPGMLLQHEDLEQLNNYTRDLSRLLFRSFFGCGVVCGLLVDSYAHCGKVWVAVSSGLGLDCMGDPIYVPRDQLFAIDEKCDPNLKAPLWVLLCRSMKCCAPRTSMCSCDDDAAASMFTKELDCFEIRVVSKLPDCVCACLESDRKPTESRCQCVSPHDPCYQDHYKGICDCKCDGGSSCDCTCIVLAKLTQQKDNSEKPWKAEHRVRRFIRPVLMQDPEIMTRESDIASELLKEVKEERAKATADKIRKKPPAAH
jgi:hypothetical protein